MRTFDRPSCTRQVATFVFRARAEDTPFVVKLALHWQILLALGAALLLSLFATPDSAVFGVAVLDVCAFVGDWFLRALKMLIVPLILSSIIIGVASVGSGRALGRLGAKTGGYYVLTSLLAVLTGLLLVAVIEPGIVDGEPAKDRIGLHADTDSVAQKVSGRGAGDVMGVFLRMVPDNVVRAAAEGEMLGLIFFAILFGAFINRLPKELRTTQRRFWKGLNEVMMSMTNWVMLFAPIGVFGLVAKVLISTTDLAAALSTLASFVVTVVGALTVHVVVTLPLLLVLLARVSPLRHYRAMMPAILMAFSTASSSATLPLTMERVERGAGVSSRVTSFTLPLGATVNMDGTALYECVAAMFIAQAYGVVLGPVEQLTVVLVALLTSIGVAGIPSASLVAITLILATIGLPMEAVGLILAVDRLLDMCRTAVNVLSDSTAAVVVARSEGETGVLAQ
jgi:Na+/H+-dicarboxylate symporter